MLKPKRLKPGDRVAAVSLSWGGPGAFPLRYEAGKRQFAEEFGVEVIETPHARAEPAWLAAHPEARAADFMGAFADPSIQGVISTIGGDESIRLLPYVDPAVISAHPKVFMGYSDSTVSHLLCFKAGIVSFYGPSFMAGFGESGGMFPYMVNAVRRSCFEAAPIGVVEPNRDGWTVEHLAWADPANQQRRRQLNPPIGWRFLQGCGVAEGPLFGGCLEVLDWLRGTPAWPDPARLKGAILFLETSEEAPPPQAVTRMLRSLASMGVLHGLAGLLFGRPGGNVPEERYVSYDRAILRVVALEERLTSLPVVTCMDFGHTDPMFVLPYGVPARIDCARRQFEILENAVTE